MGKYSQGSVNSASFLRQQALTRQRLITESLTPSRTQTNQTTAKVNNFDLQVDGLRDDVAGLESSVSGFDARIVATESQASNAQTAANLALANSQEFVVNGGFETGDLTGWTASGVAVLSGWDQDYPHSGNYQARFAAGASCSQSINGLVSGHIIRCSFWQRGFDGRTATMTISFNGGDEQTVGSIIGVTPYTRAFKDFTVPANTTTATIKLTCDTNYIRFDDISVKDITEAKAAQSAADSAVVSASSARADAALALSIVSANAVPFVGSGSTASGDVLSTSWADNITVTVPHVQGCDVVTVSVSVFGALIGSGPLDARVLVAGSEVGATQGIPSGTLTTYPGAVSSSQMSVTMQTFIQHTNVTGPIEVSLQLKRDSSGSYSLNLDSKIMMQVKAEYGRTT